MHWESPSTCHSGIGHGQARPHGLGPNASGNLVEIHSLGEIDYPAACRLQQRIHGQRVAGELKDTLLLLEHPPTITIGKGGRLENILVSAQTLFQMGISFYFSDRGGDVTYHGPGQLVGYPIIHLRERGGDLKQYVHELEEIVIRTLRDFTIHAGRDPEHPGVWIGLNKIGAVGLSVRKGVTMHGFALNVNPCMEHFSLIHGCGFTDRKAVSMHEILGSSPSVEEVAENLIHHFSQVFGMAPLRP